MLPMSVNKLLPMFMVAPLEATENTERRKKFDFVFSL